MSSLLTKITSSATNAYQQAELSLLTGKAGKVARAAKATLMSLSTFYSALRTHAPEASDDNFDHLIKKTLPPLYKGCAADCILLAGHQISSMLGKAAAGSLVGCLALKVIQIGEKVNKHSHANPNVVLAIKMGEGILAGAAGTLLTPPLATVICGGLALVNPSTYAGAFAINGGFHTLGGFLGSGTFSYLALEGLFSCTTYASNTFSSLFEENHALLEAQLLVKHLEKEGKRSTTITYIVRQYLNLAPPDLTEQQQNERVAALYDRTATAAATSMPHQKTD